MPDNQTIFAQQKSKRKEKVWRQHISIVDEIIKGKERKKMNISIFTSRSRRLTKIRRSS